MAVVRTKKTRPGQRGETSNPPARTLTAEEAWDAYDRRARRYLGVSAEEFEAARARGEYSDMRDGAEDVDVVTVLFARVPRPDQ